MSDNLILMVAIVATAMATGLAFGYAFAHIQKWTSIGMLKRLLNEKEKELTDSKEYGEQLFLINERMRVYHDNQHFVWDGRDVKVLLRQPSHKGMVVVAAMEDIQKHFEKGWLEAREMTLREFSLEKGLLLKQQQQEDPSDNVVMMRASFGDIRFNHDFARLVNQLTTIAAEYGHTQQLRSRISYTVLDFRSYLAKKQEGKAGAFPS